MKTTLILVILNLQIVFMFGQNIHYETANNDDNEQKIIEKLKKLNKKYELENYIFTDSIIIDKNAIPHSHPKLTIHTRHLNEENRLLSTFLHENFHWYEEKKQDEVQLAIKELKKKFPKIPVGRPNGAKDEFSSYLHLLVCYWEHKALINLIGEKKALEVTKSWNHYQWIYETILKEEKYLDQLLINYDLNDLNTVKIIEPESIKETNKFIFYNHYWTNQHFFLHRVASLKRKSKLVDIIGKEELDKLNEKELKQFNEILQYYSENIIQQNSFSSNMVNFRIWITLFKQNQDLPITVFAKEWISLLNNFKPLYKKHFWGKHKKVNEEKLNKYYDLIAKLEKPVLHKLTKLAHSEWQKNKVRIDLSYYANWAGAYTLARVPSKIIIATKRPRGYVDYDFIETVFHESCHSIISSRRGAISESIKKASNELNLKAPERLWHGILFYLAGKVSQDAFEKEGIKDYEQFMYRYKLYDYYDVLQKYLDPYIKNKVALNEAVKNILKALNEG